MSVYECVNVCVGTGSKNLSLQLVEATVKFRLQLNNHFGLGLIEFIQREIGFELKLFICSVPLVCMRFVI